MRALSLDDGAAAAFLVGYLSLRLLGKLSSKISIGGGQTFDRRNTKKTHKNIIKITPGRKFQ